MPLPTEAEKEYEAPAADRTLPDFRFSDPLTKISQEAVNVEVRPYRLPGHWSTAQREAGRRAF